jgi:CheY-like chemotaxis protein
VNVCLESTGKRQFIRFDVEDTGIGIPPERQSVIFESFAQADGSTTRKFGGTGLGLTITRNIAELLDGTVTLVSEEGKGSVFTLLIPYDSSEVSKGERQHRLVEQMDEGQQPVSEYMTGHILVAEDSPGNKVLVETLLRKLGFEVTIVNNGREAVDKVKAACNYDLILMDMQMPDMNGFEATRILRQEGYTLPIIAFTAFAMKGDEEKCIEAGCDDYLAKPVNKKKLTAMLSKYLTQKPVA